MKTRILKSLSLFALLLSFQLSTSNLFAQQTDPIRGIYVDQFVSYNNNSTTHNPFFSTLGIWDSGSNSYKKENELLNYCSENHITYLCLYDIRRILGNNSILLYDSISQSSQNLEYHLCRFIQKARNNFCITQIGVAGVSKQFYCDVLNVNCLLIPSAIINPGVFPQSFLNEFPFVTDPNIQSGDSLFVRSELLKDVLRTLIFSITCSAQIDVLNLEDEYWNTGNYGSVNGFQQHLADIDKVKRYYNANLNPHPATPVISEVYLGFLQLNTPGAQSATQFMDGCPTCTTGTSLCTFCTTCTTYTVQCAIPPPRLADRIFLHYYNTPANPSTCYNYGNTGGHTRTYYFANSSTTSYTDIQPLFSSEALSLGAGNDFFGSWINQQPYMRNIFEAERLYYNQRILEPNDNMILPGDAQWFASSYNIKGFNHPSLFRSTNNPIMSGANGTFNFVYQGPIEDNISSAEFWVMQGANLAYPTSGHYAVPISTYTTGNPNLSLPTNVTLNSNNAVYHAFLKLNYPNGCSYTDTVPLFVNTLPHVIVDHGTLPEGPIDQCEGSTVMLLASSNASSYQWLQDGLQISGATGQNYLVSATGTYNYSCIIGGVTSNNVITVSLRPNPIISISASCTGLPSNTITLSTLPASANAIYIWSTGFTSSTTNSISVNGTADGTTYEVIKTQNNGCVQTAQYFYAPLSIVKNTGSSNTNKNVTCNGGNDGAIDITRSGGKSPFSYLWTPGSLTTADINSLTAGTYLLIVTDNIGCQNNSFSQIVTEPPVINYTLNTTNVNCFGGNNGSITFSNVTGGNGGPFAYSWLPNVSSTNSASNLSFGNYQITIKDNFQCPKVVNVTITQPAEPFASFVASPICQGNALNISLTGTPNWTVVYNDAGGNHSVNNITSSPFTLINNPTADTYTLISITDGNSCSSVLSGQATVLSVPSISLSPNSTICAGSSVSLTASGANTFSWTPSTGLSCNTCSVAIASPTATTTYTVVGTSGTCTGSSTVTVNVVGGGILLDQNYFDSNPVIGPGNYYLVSPVTLTQSVELDNCIVSIASGVTITVPNPYTLTLRNGSELSSCGNMWRGIIILSGGTFTTISSSPTCKIKDAQYGLDVRDGGNINIDMCEFINDWIGINLADAGSAFPITVNGSIKNTSFYTSGALKPGNPSGIPYYQYSHSFAGIRAINVSYFNIGVNDGLSINRFYDINFGLFSTNSNLNFTDYSFRRVTQYDGPPNISSASLAKYGSAVYSEGTPTANYITMAGRKSSSDPDFQDCRYGVNSSNSSVDIQNNRIENCDFGIFVSKGNSLSIKAIKNYIDCNTFGISLVVVDRYSNSFIQQNEIYGGQRATCINGTTAAATGINVAGYNLNKTNTLINQNAIHLYDYGLTGINLNAIKSSIVNFNYITLHNLVNNTMRGISLAGSQLNNINCNSVHGTFTSQINYSTAETAYDIFDSRSNDIKCNGGTNTSNGIRFSGTCHSGITPTTLRSNDIGNHFNGLVYTASALVDPQVNMGNWWYLNTYAGFAATNLNPSSANVANQLYHVYANLPSHQNLPVSSEIFVQAMIPWFTTVPTDDANCGNIGSHRSDCNLYTEPYPGGGGSYAAYSMDEQVALDQINSSTFNEETKWKDKVALYEKLLKMPTYKDNHQVLSDFFQSMAGSIIQKVASINLSNDEITPNQEVLLLTIENNSISIYQKADTIRTCDSTLATDGLYEIQKESLIQLRLLMIDQIKQLINFNKQAFTILESMLSTQADFLNSENNEITSSEVYEQNERIINEIYLNGIVKNDPVFFHANSNNILEVAQQCPLAGGPAVHRARSLYMLIDPEVQYDDELVCLQSGWLLRTASKKLLPIGVFPNPASSEVTITYNIENEQILQIVDNLGRISMQFLLNPNESRTTKNISSLSDGIYALRINGKDNMENSFGRLTIIR